MNSPPGALPMRRDRDRSQKGSGWADGATVEQRSGRWWSLRAQLRERGQRGRETARAPDSGVSEAGGALGERACECPRGQMPSMPPFGWLELEPVPEGWTATLTNGLTKRLTERDRPHDRPHEGARVTRSTSRLPHELLTTAWSELTAGPTPWRPSAAGHEDRTPASSISAPPGMRPPSARSPPGHLCPSSAICRIIATGAHVAVATWGPRWS